jgi:hypothetical protein
MVGDVLQFRVLLRHQGREHRLELVDGLLDEAQHHRPHGARQFPEQRADAQVREPLELGARDRGPHPHEPEPGLPRLGDVIDQRREVERRSAQGVQPAVRPVSATRPSGVCSSGPQVTRAPSGFSSGSGRPAVRARPASSGGHSSKPPRSTRATNFPSSGGMAPMPFVVEAGAAVTESVQGRTAETI